MNWAAKVFVLSLFVTGVFAADAIAQDVVTAGIVNGKAWSLPKPEYSPEAKAAGIEGVVFVDVLIDESGNVVSAVASIEPRKMRNPGMNSEETEVPVADPILRDASERAALKARFSPTLLSGEPVKVKGTVVYRFVAKSAVSNLNGGVLNGKAVSLPAPAYPAAAIAVRAEGTVVVQIQIGENGEVISAEALSGHPLLRAAAVEAAKLASFAPTTLSGQPVKVSGVVTYNFVAPKIEN